MDTNTSIASGIDISSDTARYDAACKRLLSEKEILARILKECVDEFKDCEIKDIVEKYIEGKPFVGEYPVDRDGIPRIEGGTTEDKTLREGTVFYDIRFMAQAPTTGEPISLIINIEAQNQSNPGYPLIKRALYYCSRLISAQQGTEFKHSEYEKAKKVYSIWICPHPQADRYNTITKYRVTEENVIGSVKEELKNYDMLCAVMVCLGDKEIAESKNLLRMLGVLLSETMQVNEKKEILEKDFSIPMSEQIAEEAIGMCNLGEGLVARSRAEGRAEGITKGIARERIRNIQGLKRMKMSDEAIAQGLGISVNEVRAALKARSVGANE